MLAKQQKILDTKMTLPTADLATLKLTTPQINNYDLMADCTTVSYVRDNQQQQMQQQQQQESHLNAQSGAKTTATTTAAPSLLPAPIATTQQLTVDLVMPGIYLSKNFTAWNEQNLRLHRFTHIIIIDKHIQELYYPSSPMLKFSDMETTDSYNNCFDMSYAGGGGGGTQLKFGKEFEALNLNFGEKSYLTTVLPNCYRAVKFISKALQAGGTILVIDCNGGEQKCLTIVVAFLMYKNNISFSDAFSRLKSFYNKADLDRFYTSQLYEYEPILQVQRAQARGHSCSRELHAAQLKRKQIDGHAAVITSQCTNDLLDTLNPLTQFNPHQQQQQQQQHVTTLQQQHLLPQTKTLLATAAKSSTFHDWYSYVMD